MGHCVGRARTRQLALEVHRCRLLAEERQSRSSDERMRKLGGRVSAGVGHEACAGAGRWAEPVARGAEAHPVAGTHLDFVQDAAAVDVGAVGRPEVTKPPSPIAAAHSRVSARYRRIRKNTVAFA